MSLPEKICLGLSHNRGRIERGAMNRRMDRNKTDKRPRATFPSVRQQLLENGSIKVCCYRPYGKLTGLKRGQSKIYFWSVMFLRQEQSPAATVFSAFEVLVTHAYSRYSVQIVSSQVIFHKEGLTKVQPIYKVKL